MQIVRHAAAFVFLRRKNASDQIFKALLTLMQCVQQRCPFALTMDAINRGTYHFEVHLKRFAIVAVHNIIWR